MNGKENTTLNIPEFVFLEHEDDRAYRFVINMEYYYNRSKHNKENQGKS